MINPQLLELFPFIFVIVALSVIVVLALLNSPSTDSYDKTGEDKK